MSCASVEDGEGPGLGCLDGTCLWLYFVLFVVYVRDCLVGIFLRRRYFYLDGVIKQ